MRMPARTAAHLYDTPLSKDQVITQTRTDAAYVTVSATVNDSPQLLWWLLGFGQQVEVLAPKRLQKAIREH
jgi:predicted DNA-binding transcriptional regulator YafY